MFSEKVTLIVAKLLSILTILILLIPQVSAWWDCNWNYRIPITITETSGNNLKDYPIQLTIDTATLISQGKMRTDCGDIRFTYIDPNTGSEIEVPYWIRTGCNTATTEIWISVPNIPANGVITAYMYYGNPSAISKSNQAAVCPYGIIAGYCAEFGDTFDSGTLDSRWQITLGTFGNEVVVGLYCNPESGNAFTTRWTDSITVTSIPLDFSDGTPRIIRYYYEQGSDTDPYWCENPETGEDLYIEYFDNTGTWQVIGYYAGADTTTEGVGQVYSGTLPAAAYHANFQLRIRRVGGSGQDWDYWIVDNIVIAKQPGLAIVSLGTEEFNGIRSFSLVTPTNASTVSTDTPTINVSLVRDNYDCAVSCTLRTIYPTSSSFSMTTSQNNDYCYIQLDLNGLVQQDGRLDYQIDANLIGTSYTYTSPIYTLYVPTSHTINVNSPTNNSIVYGTVDISTTSDSVLDITTCIIETNLGNYSGTLISDTTCQYSIDLSNSCPDNLWLRIWMQNSAGVWNTTSWYFVDNDIIYNLQVTSPTNGSTVNSDIVTIKATYQKSCNQPIDVYIDFLYPSTSSDLMSCIGTSCTYTKDLNYFVQPDGKVDYRIRAIHPNEQEQTGTYTFYIPTSHTVTVITPKVGDPVLGSGFHVKVQSDSVLKLDSCYPNLPPGAIAENIILDPTARTCEFDVNLENYCTSNTIDFSVTLQNTAGVNATSPVQSHLIYDPPIEIQFTSKTPVNSTNLRYLPIEVQVNKVLLGGKYVPSTKKFMYEVQGTNYTVYGDDNGYAIMELFHPNITSILGTKGPGSITFRVYGIGRCSNINATEQRTVAIPPTIYKVDFVTPPTPQDGATLSIKFMEVQGQVTENILANTKCTLEVSKDNGFTWIPIKEMDSNCYAYLVNNELDTPLGYLLYRINITDSRWGETNTSLIRTVNIPPSAEPIPTVNPSMDNAAIQTTIDDAISQRKPALLFESGVYRVNLKIVGSGIHFRILGPSATFIAASRGFPTLEVLGSNVTIEGITIKDSLFNLKITNAQAITLKDVKVYGGLWGVEAKGSQINILGGEYSSKIAGAKLENVENSTIKDAIIKGDVWGIQLINVNNITIDSVQTSAKVFGIDLKGNNNVINNVTVSVKVFGVYIQSGTGNTINNSLISAEIFGINTKPSNTIENTIIKNNRVFGIYSTGSLTIRNVTSHSSLFNAYFKGSAENLTAFGGKLGVKVSGSGLLKNLNIDGTLVDVSYNGDFMLSKKDPTAKISGVVYTGQAVYALGKGEINITFYYNNPIYSQYYIYKIVGSIAELYATGKFVNATGMGLYSLYAS